MGDKPTDTPPKGHGDTASEIFHRLFQQARALPPFMGARSCSSDALAGRRRMLRVLDRPVRRALAASGRYSQSRPGPHPGILATGDGRVRTILGPWRGHQIANELVAGLGTSGPGFLPGHSPPVSWLWVWGSRPGAWRRQSRRAMPCSAWRAVAFGAVSLTRHDTGTQAAVCRVPRPNRGGASRALAGRVHTSNSITQHADTKSAARF
jgi:hypothetical protein